MLVPRSKTCEDNRGKCLEFSDHRSFDVRAAEGRCLFMAYRIRRDNPGQLRGRPDVFGIRTTIGVCSTLDETRDVVPNLGSDDILAGLHNIPRPVTSKDRPWLRHGVNNCSRSDKHPSVAIRINSRTSVHFQSVGFWARATVFTRMSSSPTAGTG